MDLPRRSIAFCLAVAAVFSLGTASAALGAVTLEEVGAFDEPTFITSEPGHANRLIVTERSGLIKEFDGSTSSVFLDLRPQVQYVNNNFCCFEKGLFSIVFAPDYATSHAFYAVYTGGEDLPAAPHGDIVLDEFKTDGAGVALPASRREVLRIPHPNNHHYGGQLAFGPDGYLYLSVGDGSATIEPQEIEKAQNLNSLLGKILRIDPHQSGANTYTIPADNPFVGQAGKRAEIWSYGFRNPWRFSFDSANGALTVGDVGDVEWEEVNYVLPSGGKPAGWGQNFGWPCREGAQTSTFTTTPADGCPLASSYTDPIFQYGHETIDSSPEEACAVMGGYVAHDPSLGDLDGRYVYADLCASQLRSFSPSATPPVTDRFEVDIPSPSPGVAGMPETFGQDSCGRIYVGTALSRVYRMVGPSPTVCPRPSSPVLSSISPTLPANDNTPKVKGTAEAGTTVTLYSSANCTGMPIGSGSASQLAGGVAVSVPDNSSTAIRATASSKVETSACSAPISYIEDSTAPETQLTSGPAGSTASTSATFAFSSEPGAIFECSFGSTGAAGWAACASPKDYSSLADGSSYTFEVRARDQAGNTDPTPAKATFTVNVPKPPPVATKATLKVVRPAKDASSKTVLQASVSPCAGRKGSAVQLKRGAKVLLRGRLDAKCHATFKVRAAQGTKLRAFVPELSPYAAGTSKPVTVPPPSSRSGSRR